ncbi:MAG: hypothetical protein JO211_09435, partial [Acidobacteriaceae bacterium]|nr:hypothetical protein [Acidobacteriaceae bacterium]
MKIVVKRSWVILASVWGFTAFAIWPVLRHRVLIAPRQSRTVLAIEIAYALAALFCFCFYRAEARRLGRSRALGLVMLIVLLNGFVNEVHQYNVDQRKDLFVNLSNEDWQEKLQADVVRLRPPIAPHTYRFLPNAIVLWMQICRVRFDAARDIYRMLTGLV